MCGGTLFLIKLHAGENNINMVDLLSFFLLCHLEQNSNFSHNLRSVFLLITGKSVNCLHFANVTSNVRSCVDSLGKSSKSNDTRVSAQSYKGK